MENLPSLAFAEAKNGIASSSSQTRVKNAGLSPSCNVSGSKVTMGESPVQHWERARIWICKKTGVSSVQH